MQTMLETVPWLLPVASWLLATLVVWLLASVPALLIRRLTVSAKVSIGSIADRFREGASAGQDVRRVRRAESRAAYIAGLADRPIDDALHAQWLSDVVVLAEPLTVARNSFVEAQTLNNKVLPELASIKEALVTLSPDRFALPDIPHAREAAAMEQHRSAAMLNLCLGILLLVPIILVNAQLTALVLREAVPDIQGMFAAIPPAFAIAVALTIAEAGLGAAHGAASAENEEAGRQYTVGLLVLTLLGLLVVLMELLLYSQFRESGAEPFALPLLGILVPAGSAFGLIGLILGSSVLVLGRMTYVAARTVSRRRSMKSVLGRYESIKNTAVRLAQAADEHSTTLVEVSKFVGEFHEQLKERRLLLAVEQYDAKVRAFLNRKPEWVTPTTRVLSQGEVLTMESSALFSLLAATVGIFVMAAVAAGVIALGLPRSGLLVPTAGGLMAGLTILYAGHSIGANWGSSRRASSATFYVTLASVGALSLACGYLAGGLLSWSSQTMAIIGLIAAGTLLLLIGVRLHATGPFAFLIIRSLFITALWIPILALSGVLYMLWLLALVVDAVVGLISQPAELLASAFTRTRA